MKEIQQSQTRPGKKTAVQFCSTGDAAAQKIGSNWQQFDLPAIQKKLVHDASDATSRELIVSAEAIHCASCSMLIEKELGKIDGLLDVEVSVTNRRVRLRWQPDIVKLSQLLQKLDEIGFTPHPLKGGSDRHVLENRQALKRLLVAGLGMMQVMMYAVGLYAGAFQGMTQDMQWFLHSVSLLVATPVVLYSGRPFFQAAWSSLRHGSVGMDVPVSLAITIAYTASIRAVFIGSGNVYFDSVTMFIFFLSLGRFAEMKARHRAGAASDALAQLTPATALLVGKDGEQRVVPVEELQIGDELLIKAGQTIPTDSVLLDAGCKVDESLLTGESRLVNKACGAELIGGSINHSGVIRARVQRIGNETMLSHISRLLQRAQSERPRLSHLADKVASYFVTSVLGLSVLVGLFWWFTEPSRALEIVLAVLVVTCPCALSLATPAALTVAIGRLAREGLLVTHAEAIEKLAKVGYALFDKTGTLTFGQLRIRQVFPLADLSSESCVELAAALEKYSEHPIASAFDSSSDAFHAENIQILPGLGIEGQVKSGDGKQYRCRIGKIEFVAELSHTPVLSRPSGAEDSSWVALGDNKQVLAWFELGDVPRPDLGTTCSQLKRLGLKVEMLSGDRSGAVKHLAEQLCIRGRWLLTPDAKLDYMRALQRDGEQVLMVGDGINDAPVLACADVSIAMSGGTNLAQTSADMVLMQDSLSRLPMAVAVSRRTLKIIRQNIVWAIAYNAIALPLAAAGLILPWVAAIGMSFSSLLVVLNALRLGGRNGSKAAVNSLCSGWLR